MKGLRLIIVLGVCCKLRKPQPTELWRSTTKFLILHKNTFSFCSHGSLSLIYRILWLIIPLNIEGVGKKYEISLDSLDFGLKFGVWRWLVGLSALEPGWWPCVSHGDGIEGPHTLSHQSFVTCKTVPTFLIYNISTAGQPPRLGNNLGLDFNANPD